MRAPSIDPMIDTKAVEPERLDRRRLLQGVAAGAAAWSACSSSASSPHDVGAPPDGGRTPSDAAPPDDAAFADAEVPADTGTVDIGAVDASVADLGPEDAGVAATGWASGGTAAMTAKARYPNPFTSVPAACALVASSTAGPCTTEDDLDREDISEAGPGLPVRLALRFVDRGCEPLAGVIIKIWHTNYAGVYSGETPAQAFCSGGDATAVAANWFRGARRTDAEGVVYFDTCYPGWYPGRAIHIHFQVKDANRSYQISQLYFPLVLSAEIFRDHPVYQVFGQPDTTNRTDGIARQAPELGLLTLDVARMEDGAMLASKTVAVMS